MESNQKPPRRRSLILIVIAVAVVLVAVGLLYVLTLAKRAPQVLLVPSTPIDGEGFLIYISKSTPWDDFTIRLDGPSNTSVSWTPSSSRLDQGTSCSYIDGPKALGSLNVSCNLTDLEGNGCVDKMDFFTLIPGPDQAFTTGTLYTVTIIYEPMATEVCEVSFVA